MLCWKSHCPAGLRQPGPVHVACRIWARCRSITLAARPVIATYVAVGRCGAGSARRRTGTEPASAAARRPPVLKTGGQQAPGRLPDYLPAIQLVLVFCWVQLGLGGR